MKVKASTHQTSLLTLLSTAADIVQAKWFEAAGGSHLSLGTATSAIGYFSQFFSQVLDAMVTIVDSNVCHTDSCHWQFSRQSGISSKHERNLSVTRTG